MKKHFILSITAITLTLFALAQKRSVEIGIHGGLNINSASGSAVDAKHKSTLTGIVIGGHIKFNISEHFGINALLQYDQCGFTYHGLTFEDRTATTLANGDAIIKLNYLNLPVIAEYSFGNTISVRIGAGVFFGILLNNRLITKVNEPLPPYGVTTTDNSSNDRSTVNFGITANAGLQIPVSAKLKIDADVRDNYGLHNISKGSSGMRTNALSFSTGLSVRL